MYVDYCFYYSYSPTSRTLLSFVVVFRWIFAPHQSRAEQYSLLCINNSVWKATQLRKPFFFSFLINRLLLIFSFSHQQNLPSETHSNFSSPKRQLRHSIILYWAWRHRNTTIHCTCTELVLRTTMSAETTAKEATAPLLKAEEGEEEGNTKNALSARELAWAVNSPELIAEHKRLNGPIVRNRWIWIFRWHLKNSKYP